MRKIKQQGTREWKKKAKQTDGFPPISTDNSDAILIVEDEVPLLDVLEYRFSEEGYRVLTATNGEDGLRLALNEHPACILLDLLMPRMNGMDLLRSLRKDSWGKQASVIVLTNMSTLQRLPELKRSKVFDYVIKSNCTIEEILSTVREVVPSS